MRRRRRARPLWFPPLGSIVNGVDKIIGGTTFNVPVLANTDTFAAFLPLTFDQGQEDNLAAVGQKTLADLMSSAWRLRRMITNVFGTYNLTGEGALDVVANQPKGAAFAVGTMVLAADATGTPLQIPDPLLQGNYDDPWIWRRVWVLGQDMKLRRNSAGALEGGPATGGAVLDVDSAFGHFPWSTTDYGYLAGGAHIDQKTNRVIGPEQRLFMIFSTKALSLNTVFTVDASITGFLEYRLLGGLQRSSNRRNASR